MIAFSNIYYHIIYTMDAVPWESAYQNTSDELLDCFKQLSTIWEECGYSEDSKLARINSVECYVKELLSDLLNEERKHKGVIIKKIEDLLKESEELKKDLNMNIVVPDSMTVPLCEVEKTLRLTLVEYRKLKDSRLERLAVLKNQEKELCDILGIQPEPQFENAVPRDEQLMLFERQLSLRVNEKIHLQNIFENSREAIMDIMTSLEMTPTMQFEKLVVNNPVQFKLTKENMIQLQDLQQRLELDLENRKGLEMALREKLTQLWDRLQESIENRGYFLDLHPGFTTATVEALKVEIRRCENLKRQNIKIFVSTIREELLQLWDRCCYSEEQRSLFHPYRSDFFNEDLLELHELEVKKLDSHYKDNVEIYKLAEKRAKFWDKMTDLEERASDPNRFCNRGGQLLKEEKERKLIQKELPKIENELTKLVKIYEERTKTNFLLYGKKISDIIGSEWDIFKGNKEMKKIARKERDRTQVESKVGTRNQPSKRKLVSNTPTPNVTKQRRVLVDMNTPNPRMDPGRTKKVARKIFNEGRAKTTAVSASQKVLNARPLDASGASNMTSYTDFQDRLEELNEGETCRSSVVPGRFFRERKTPAQSARKATPAKPPRNNRTNIPQRTTRSNPRVPWNANRSPAYQRGSATTPRLTNTRGKLPIII